jgi:hypothetical protein
MRGSERRFKVGKFGAFVFGVLMFAIGALWHDFQTYDDVGRGILVDDDPGCLEIPAPSISVLWSVNDFWEYPMTEEEVKFLGDLEVSIRPTRKGE